MPRLIPARPHTGPTADAGAARVNGARLTRPGALRRRLRRFGRDTDGTVAFEAMIILPVLLFAMLMTVLLSDMFRSQNTALRAAYTVADTLSRRVDPVDVPYLDGSAVLYRYLARARHGAWMRISSIAFSEAEDRYIVVWSHHAANGDSLTTEQLNQGLHERLPSMPTGETVILVEAGTEWQSFAQNWFPPREFRQVVVTRPRFTSQLRFDDGTTIIFLPDGGGTCDDGSILCDPDDDLG